MKSQPIGRSGIALALLVSFIWGGNVAALKFGLDTIPPLWSAFWRFFAGLLAVIAWGVYQRRRLWPERGEWAPLCVLALLFTSQIFLLNTGTQYTSAGYAVVLLNSHPLFTNLFGHFVASEQRLDRKRALGLALAFAGVWYVSLGRPEARLAPQPLLGNSMMVASAALLAARVIFTRRIVLVSDALRPVLWQMALCLPVFLLLAARFEPMTVQPLEWDVIAAILYQGVLVAGFCFIVWTGLLRKHSAGTLSIFGFTVPFFGVALSAAVFDERVPANLLIGAALVTAGIYVVTRPSLAAELRTKAR
jgi:drug/metabolite transporter (DMT)-like permease